MAFNRLRIVYVEPDHVGLAMRFRRKVHLSERMRRNFPRAILAAMALAGLGIVLVYAALSPRPPPPPKLPSSSVTADSCTQSLAQWAALEATLTHATALAADLGARCRLLTCPDTDCGSLQDLGAAVAGLMAGLQIVVAAPQSVTDRSESTACGAVIAPLARRLEPGLKGAHEALDLCAAQAHCSALRGVREGLGGPIAEQLRAGAARLERISRALRLGESPAVTIALDLTTYMAGDAMAIDIDPSRNRCLAQGGVAGIYADRGLSALSDPPLAQAPVMALGRLLMEAPAAPGRYLVAVTGQGAPGRALGSRPFAVEGQRSGCSGFAGRWETDRGILTASVRHGVLRGTYRHPGAVQPGFLTGRVKGRHAHGTWVSELGSGGAHLVLNETGDRFLGTAGSKPGEEDGAGLWRGHCLLSKDR
jgi:hypothetical protein